MGRVKQEYLEMIDSGLSKRNYHKFVCGQCIEDSELAGFIAGNATSNYCDYCGRHLDMPFAMPLDDIIEHIICCISRAYDEPVNIMSWNGEEGGWLGTVYTIDEVFEEIGFLIEDTSLMDDIKSSIRQEEWCHANLYSCDSGQEKAYGWRDFKEAVKHERRYTFWSLNKNSPGEEYIPVGKMMKEIEKVIHDSKIIKSIPKGIKIWRIRITDASEEILAEKEFVVAPKEKALQSNRMSPAGIPMFYGAEDFETAVLETVDFSNNSKIITGGYFVTQEDLNVLDLTKLPNVPSFFNDDLELVYSISFLHSFVKDVSKPINRDGRIEHIEYVPTQVFTEYIRWEMVDEHNKNIDGIVYASSKNGRPCYVLFCSSDECLEVPKCPVKRRWLKFDINSLKTIKVKDFRAKMAR